MEAALEFSESGVQSGFIIEPNFSNFTVLWIIVLIHNKNVKISKYFSFF